MQRKYIILLVIVALCNLGGATRIIPPAGAPLLTSKDNALSTTTDSASGMELIGGLLTLLQGCADNELLKWDETDDDWNCEADAGAAGGDSISVDSVAVVDPDFQDGGDIGVTDTTNVITWDINAGVIVNADMANDALDADKIVGDAIDDGDLDVAAGGTGLSTLTNGGVMLGSGAGDVTPMAALADGEFIVGDGATDPVAESGATLRTSIGVGTGDTLNLTVLTLGADPADDAGASIRLGDLDSIHWEGTNEVGISTGGADGFIIENSQAGITMGITTATECVMLNAAAINCKTTGGCATATVAGDNFDYVTADFDSAGDESGTWTFPMPVNIAGTTFVASVYWTSNSALCTAEAADDVCWTVAGASVIDNGDWDGAALGTSQGVDDVCIADGDLMHTSNSDAVTHGWVNNGLAVVQVVRDIDGGHADCTDDRYPADASLLSVEVCYEVDNVFSGE